MFWKSYSVVSLIDSAKRSDQFRLVRYLIAGAIVSLGYTLTIVALVSWLRLMSANAANVVSLVLWSVISYVAHREFTFRFDGEHGGSGARFVFVVLLKLGASIAVIAAITRYNAGWYLIGVIVNWVVLPLVSYVALKLWVFQRGFVQRAPAPLDGLLPTNPEVM